MFVLAMDKCTRVYYLALGQVSERVCSVQCSVCRSGVKTPPSRWKLHPVHGQSYAMQFARVLCRACETSGFALWWMPCVVQASAFRAWCEVVTDVGVCSGGS